MKAKDVTGQAPGGVRQRLADILPLNTPLLVEIFPIYACNFKCRYCIMSVKREKHNFISEKVALELSDFKKYTTDIGLFPQEVKVVRFSGVGEPLLHKNISEMVEYVSPIVGSVEILTNGSLLTPKLSDKLIKAGLGRLLVSIQGTSSEKYKRICGVDINLKQFIDNLRYYFEHKGEKQQVHIKIIDYALDDEADEQRFYQNFGDVCDTIGIERLGAIHPNVNYEKMLCGRNKKFTQYGVHTSNIQVCPQPFFRLQINPDGKVVPCYSLVYPTIIGDCNNDSIYDIWNGGEFGRFRRKMLNGIKNVCTVCANCEMIKHRIFPEDVLDNNAERLKRIYNNDM